MSFIAAAAAYPFDWHEDWQSYADKVSTWVTTAAGQGAELLVFPEYAGLDVIPLAGAEACSGLESALRAAGQFTDQVDALHAALAAEHQVTLLAGSAPVWGGARPTNQARLYGPEGRIGAQDKQIMTRFEREHWNVVSGAPLQVFDTPVGRVGVLICYDAEFPLLGRRLAEAGVEILLVPSCTDALAGYWRVRIGAMARALENQCVVLHAPTVGTAHWCPGIDENCGAAGVYGPPDRGFPSTGVLAEGELSVPGWVYAEIDLQAVHEVRRDGRVLNFAHWDEQERNEALPV